MTVPLISKEVARRFVLGRQGLWPGRRWAGKAGTAQALQIDPLNVVARNHDLTLLSRVADYRAEYLDELIYHDRAFFDYGGTVFIYPMNELPDLAYAKSWRVVMRQKGREERWAKFAALHPEALVAVRRELRARGPLGNRDIEGQKSMVGNFRSGKDTGLAFYCLWLTGEWVGAPGPVSWRALSGRVGH
jgi:uncharacterized protein